MEFFTLSKGSIQNGCIADTFHLAWCLHVPACNFTGRGGGRGGSRGGGAGGRMMPDPQSSQVRRPAMVQSRIEVASPYKGWKLYFPEEGKFLRMISANAYIHVYLFSYKTRAPPPPPPLRPKTAQKSRSLL